MSEEEREEEGEDEKGEDIVREGAEEKRVRKGNAQMEKERRGRHTTGRSRVPTLPATARSLATLELPNSSGERRCDGRVG